MLTAAVDITVISLKKTLLKWLLVLIHHLNLYIRDEGTVFFLRWLVLDLSVLAVLSEVLREVDLL